MQIHLLEMYCSVQASPMLANVIVPVPEDFQPALLTVITILPESAIIAKVLICPSTPAASVAVSGLAVEKYDTEVAKLAAAAEARSSLP